MNTKLNYEQDWLKLGKQVNWSVEKLAKLCGVSTSTLGRHFHQRLGASPSQWLTEQRLKLAIELMKGGSSVKETASQLGYQHSQTFSREFKKHWGFCPTKLFEICRRNLWQRSSDAKGYTMNDLTTSICF